MKKLRSPLTIAVTAFVMAMAHLHVTKWLWPLIMLSSPLLDVSKAATVNPQNGPELVEAQAKFFQDFFSVHLSPYKMEFGHVCEDPDTWEQRYEHKDFKNHRDMGKVRWGDKHGGYGEHYWDLNHAGHNDNDDSDRYSSDSDDGSYKVHDNDPYDEPSEQSPNYDSEYDPEKASHEDYNRAKRDHKRTPESFHNIPRVKPKRKKFKPTTTTESPIVVSDEPEVQYKSREANFDVDENEETTNDQPENKDSTGDVQLNQYASEPKYSSYAAPVPYEDGAGVRQHYAPEASFAESAPRLFLEPSTGHVVDRTTGQAYVLQPIAGNNRYYN